MLAQVACPFGQTLTAGCTQKLIACADSWRHQAGQLCSRLVQVPPDLHSLHSYDQLPLKSRQAPDVNAAEACEGA